jgi:hypothetical protein
MTIDDAVKRVVTTHLTNGGYCTEQRAKELAQEVSQEVYEHFRVDSNAILDEVAKIRERQDRLWDALHAAPPNRFKKFFGKLLWWRK